jgi:hypothetical protein
MCVTFTRRSGGRGNAAVRKGADRKAPIRAPLDGVFVLHPGLGEMLPECRDLQANLIGPLLHRLYLAGCSLPLPLTSLVFCSCSYRLAIVLLLLHSIITLLSSYEHQPAKPYLRCRSVRYISL